MGAGDLSDSLMMFRGVFSAFGHAGAACASGAHAWIWMPAACGPRQRRRRPAVVADACAVWAIVALCVRQAGI